MFAWTLVVMAAIVVAVGQALLIRAAWQFRRAAADLPPGVPRSNPHGDLAWTLLTAVGTVAVLVFVFQSLL